MSIRKSIAFSFVSKYLLILIQLVSAMVLSRLLTPVDFGIYSVAYALVNIGHVFRDFGVCNYINQEKELTNDKIKSAMSLTLFFAWTMSAVLYFGAEYAAAFYHEAGVKNVFQVLALNFLLIPFSSVLRSYARRELRFKFLMILEVAGSVVTTSTVIALAYMNYSYMSMAWSSVVGVIFDTFLLNVFRPKGFPVLPGFKEIKNILNFGVISFFETLLSQSALYFPDLLIGKFLNMHAVGILSRAEGTAGIFERLVNQGIAPVMLPYFAKENREGFDIKPTYLYATKCLVVLAWPAFAFIAIMAEPITNVLYGSQWGDSVLLLQIICFSGATSRLIGFAHPALLSHGHVKELLRVQVILMPTHLFVMIFTIGNGLVYMIATVSIGLSILKVLIVTKILNHRLGIRLRDTVGIISACFMPTLACSAAVILIQHNLKTSDLYNLIISSVVFGLVFLLSIFVFNHPIKKEIVNAFGSIFLSGRRFVMKK